MELKKKFGKRIQELRLKNNWKQSELAEKVGIASKTQSCIETGKNFPSAELIEKKYLEYHKKNTRDRELEEEILFRIDRFEAKYSLLSKNMSVDVFLAARLRAAITLDNFQTDQHTSQSITSSIYGSIKSGTMAIIDDLHNAK